ncbi:hypothetical protein SS50377_25404 [Spironucleus salmonicida]|uniref:Uncharacterized protein n=1 Tax=Spironucleus salmonicida TaxID=348837 RepID=V6LVV1_9EUKA|nr:hypothetical protein SS50377_25404 [Spironucleus salmonicida]|eukprot:EST44949.1 Hypothetical protein SS50377_14966 [Spironucleus salmonicida]
MDPFMQIIQDLNNCIESIDYSVARHESKSVYNRLSESKFYTGSQREIFKNKQLIVQNNNNYRQKQKLNRFTPLSTFLRTNIQSKQLPSENAPDVYSRLTDIKKYTGRQKFTHQQEQIKGMVINQCQKSLQDTSLSSQKYGNVYSAKFYESNSSFAKFNKQFLDNIESQ